MYCSVVCDCCNKRFTVDLVSQVVRIKGEARYACSEGCRGQLMQEAGGLRLGAMNSPQPLASAASTRSASSLSVSASPAVAVAVAGGAPDASSVGFASSATTPFAPTPASTPAPESGPRVTHIERKLAAPKKLAVFNHKGGTGKTTTSVSVAAGLAERGLKVLLVDSDSQGNVAVSFGVKPEKTLYHVLVMGLRAEDAATNIRPNLDILPANETLAAAELYLAGRQNRDRVLRDRLASATSAYDVVVIDCSPSLSLMNQNALVLADGILVPVACDFLSLVGVRQVIKTVKNVNSLLRHPVQIYGVLPTFYDARARICRDAVETLKQHFGDKCLAPIRAATRIKEAPAQSKTIFEIAPDSNAADDYRAVVERLVTGRGAELPTETEALPDSQLAANA